LNSGIVNGLRFANKTVELAIKSPRRGSRPWKKGDQIVVYADTGTDPAVWQSFQAALINHDMEPIVVIVNRPKHDYAAVPSAAFEAMKEATGSIYVSSLGVMHSKSGQLLNKMGKGGIFAEHLTLDMMERGLKWFEPAVIEEYQEWTAKIRKAGIGAKSVRITCPHGSDYTVAVGDRPHLGTSGCTGFISAHGGVPSEAHLAIPNESSGDGILYADLTMHHIGGIKEPIKFTIEKGRIVDIDGGIEAEEFRRWLTDYGDKNSWLHGEIAFGTNPWARSTGTMREDRKIWGTMHVGFGQNLDVGGMINSVIHWDFGMRKPTCYVDGKMIAKDGKILL
jgi:leucyl aminopeptidase (aminopeptidase T)